MNLTLCSVLSAIAEYIPLHYLLNNLQRMRITSHEDPDAKYQVHSKDIVKRTSEVSITQSQIVSPVQAKETAQLDH